jgi:hypothetical protein
MVVFNFTDSDSDPTIPQPNYNSSQATIVWVLETNGGKEWRNRTLR